MAIIIEALPEAIWWKIHHESPDAWAIPNSNFRLINPLRTPDRWPTSIAALGFQQLRVITTSEWSAFSTRAMLYEADDNSMTTLAMIVKKSGWIRNQLRYLTGQYLIPTGLLSALLGIDVNLADRRTVRATHECSMLPSFGFESAVQPSHLEEALKQSESWCYPVPEQVLLDAMSAAGLGDFMKAVLYSAIAIESGVTHSLESAIHASIRNSGIISNGESERAAIACNSSSDPIKAYLLGRHGGRIRRLLHEASLYSLGRSYLEFDKAKFDRVIDLFQMRNRIAHSGEIAPNSRIQHAYDAIHVAFDVFHWLGDRKKYPRFGRHLLIEPSGRLRTEADPR